MNNKNYIIAFLFTCVIIVTSSVVSQAQILPPPPPEASGVPLDPFSWLLLGAGGLVAGKKYLDGRKLKK